MEIIVPATPKTEDGVHWPTLGPQVCDFIEDNFTYGPGPLKGQPYVVREEFRYIIYRAYEHYPAGYTKHYGGETVDLHGRRHFNEVIISVAKGWAKSELMAILALTELHPDAPVRFNGYDPNQPGGMAHGRGVSSPEIPMLAPTLDQLKLLAYGVCMVLAEEAKDSDLFDITNERIMVQGEKDSKIIPVAGTPVGLDGFKPTFLCIDESHLLFSDRHRESYGILRRGLPKRMMDDPWQITCTTAGDPSQPSIARDQYELGLKMAAGKIEEERRFFFHRQTSDQNAVFDTLEQRIIALKEASGPEAAKFRDLFAVAAEWDSPGADPAYLERVWCNRWVQASQTAFNRDTFEQLGDHNLVIPKGATVTLGFDGAVTQDSTALVATEVATGVQNLIGLWERPDNLPEGERWQVPVSEVDERVQFAFQYWSVYWMYADPPYWKEYISKWSGEHEGKIVEWFTKTTNNMYYALRNYNEAIESGELGHNGNPDLVRHIGNAGKNPLGIYDDEGLEKYRLTKIKKDWKYDAAMAAVLSWTARLDALQKGAARTVRKQKFIKVR